MKGVAFPSKSLLPFLFQVTITLPPSLLGATLCPASHSDVLDVLAFEADTRLSLDVGQQVHRLVKDQKTKIFICSLGYLFLSFFFSQSLLQKRLHTVCKNIHNRLAEK